MADQATGQPAERLHMLPRALAEPTEPVTKGWIGSLGLASLVMWMASITPLQVVIPAQLQSIDPHGKILALDTPAALKQTVGADTIVTLKAYGDTEALAGALENHVEGVTRTRVIDGGLELHVKGAERIVPRVVSASERAGFELVDLSVAEPTLETVFISLTGRELRD